MHLAFATWQGMVAVWIGTMFTDDVGVSIHGGTPIAGWFITENPFYKWMIWGYPHYWKPLGTSSTGSSPGWQNGFHMGLSKVGAR